MHPYNEADERGKSMVERHVEAQKQAMQEACLGALRRAMPNVSNETRMMALEQSNWDVETAFLQLKAFTGGQTQKKGTVVDAKARGRGFETSSAFFFRARNPKQGAHLWRGQQRLPLEALSASPRKNIKSYFTLAMGGIGKEV